MEGPLALPYKSPQVELDQEPSCLVFTYEIAEKLLNRSLDSKKLVIPKFYALQFGMAEHKWIF